MERGNSLRLYRGERKSTYVMGSQSGLMAPIALRDGRSLDVRMGLETRGTEYGRQLKVTNSVYQSESDAAGQNWIFRYEYARHPSGPR
jgi:hypothetical protein